MKSKHLLLMLLLALLAPWAANAQSPLFSEDFESGSMPTGWTTDGSGSWSVSTGDYSSSTGAGQGSYNAKITHGTTGDATKLITPEIDLSSVASAELSFMHVQRSWAGDIDGLKVYYRTSSSGTWTLLEEYTSAYASWTTEEGIVLPNLSSTYQVAFEYIDHYGYGLGVDNVIITQGASCVKPGTLTATAPYGYDAAHCILLQWEGGSGSYNVQLKKASESEEQWQSITGGFSDYALLFNTLDPLTTYNARVQSVCGGEVSDWKNVTFTTGCGAINVPQTFTFENDATSAMPDCWLRHPNNTGVYVSSSSYNAHNGSKYLTFNSGSNRYVALPEINIPATGFKVNFWTRPESATNSSCATFQVGYITNDDFSTFQMVEEYAYNDWASATYMEKTVYMPDIPTGGRIAFYHTGTSSWYWYLDDITVTVGPTCFKPTEAHADVADANNATIIWTPNPSNAEGGSYSILDAELNVVPGAEQLTGTSFSLSGLDPETDYTYYVSTNCSNSEENVDLVEVNFSTPADCGAPILAADAFTNVSAHQATVSWTGFASNNEFVVSYRSAAYLDGIAEEFDATSIPEGWTMYTGLLVGNTAELSVSTYAWSFGSGNGVFDNHARVNIYSNNQRWLVTPAITIPNNAVLDFDMALTAFSGSLSAPATTGTDDKFIVLISTDNKSTWTTLREWNNSGSAYVYNEIANSATGEDVNIDLSSFAGQSAYIAFYGESTESNADNNLHIDNVAIGTAIPAGDWQTVSPNPTTASTTLTGLTAETPYDVKVKGLCNGGNESEESDIQTFTTTIACPKPNNLTVAANAGEPTQKEDLTWVMTGAETDWQLCLNGDESNLIDINESEVSINPMTYEVFYTLSGLTPGQDYTVKVRANCEASVPGDQTSDWSNTQNFQTEATCDEPTAFAHGTVDAHNAPLSWTEAGTATQWQICINDDMDNLILISNTTAGVTVEGQNVSYTLTGLTAETPYTVKLRAYCAAGDGNQSPWVTTSFTTLVSCPAPTNLQVEANALDATFSWEGEAGSYVVVTSMNSSDNPNDLVSTPVTGNDYIFPNLELGNHYFWVRSNCSANGEGYSTWAGPASVHIGYCVPNPTSHDGSGITGVTFGMGSNVVENGNGTTSLPASAPYYGDYSSMIGAVQAGVESTISITTATGSYPYTFVIWVDLDNNMSFDDSEVLYIGKAASGAGTHNATITIPATQATGDYRMRIYGADSYFSNFYNNGSTNWEAAHDPCVTGTYRHAHDYTLRVLEAPSCMTPTNVAISYTSGTSAEVTWNGTATSYNIDINGTVTNNVTSPYTLPLELSTTYTVMVQANCGASGTSEWSNSASYTSPDCWGGHLIEYTLTDSYNDGWEDAYIYIKGKCGEIIQTLTVASGASPYSGTLNLCGDYYEIVYKQGSYPSEYAWTFTEGGSTLFTGSGSSSTDGQVFYTIGTISCSVPTNLSNEAPTINSALLSWEENGTAVAWQLCINDDMDNLVEVVQNDLTSTSGNTRSYNLSGLNQETPYTVKVRAKCSATDQSCWSEEVSFTTLASCVKPTDLTVTYTGGTEATISWTSEATVWNMRVNGVDVNGVITNPYTLTGLELATTYEVEVQANCGSNGTSEWTSPVSFTTDLCMPADQCEITMVLNDSYGDGWNGGQLSVVDVLTDQVLGTYTLSSGNSETYTLGVCNGRDINFVYAAGNFGTENGWVITDINNEVITEREGCNSGCTPTDGVQATYTVNCIVNPCKTPKDLTVGTVESQSAELSWTGEMTTYNIRYRHPQTNPTAPATIILEANDVWGDGSGYQMLLDADATAYGTLWNAQHHIFVDGVQYSGGDIPATYYDEFEYKVPTEADGSLSTTNVVVTGTVTITIPAGIYDYVFLNPTPGDKFYVAADNGNVGGAEDNFVFEPGVTYHFTMQQIDGTSGDGAMLTVTPISDWVVVENVTSTSYTLTGLTPLSMYECQVKGFSSECTEGTEWSESVTFTTDVPSFTKTILANNWYALSSPVNTPNVTDVNNLTVGTYDFYRYDESSSTWENYKHHNGEGSAIDDEFTTFENGRGYIYRNSTGNDLTFTGVPNTATNYPYLLTAEGSGDLAGFNLLGNPYTTDYNYSGVCYNLTEKGTWKVNATGYNIPVCEAILIKVESETPCSFTSSKSAPKAAEALALTVSGNGYEDVTYAMLEDGKGLNKVAHLADEAPALSIPVDGSNYAIAYLGYEVESFPLTLNATAGEYTIALNNQISGLSYCHLLDKVTGKETDLLKGAYTFKANGNSDRFTVLLNASLENGEIAIWNGNSWIVNGEGTLQVFDVMGRRVYNQEVAGQSSLNTDELATGVYVIRLGEKSQKIVVK